MPSISSDTLFPTSWFKATKGSPWCDAASDCGRWVYNLGSEKVGAATSIVMLSDIFGAEFWRQLSRHQMTICILLMDFLPLSRHSWSKHWTCFFEKQCKKPPVYWNKQNLYNFSCMWILFFLFFIMMWLFFPIFPVRFRCLETSVFPKCRGGELCDDASDMNMGAPNTSS